MTCHLCPLLCAGEARASGGHHAVVLRQDGARRAHPGGGGRDRGHWHYGKDGEWPMGDEEECV